MNKKRIFNLVNLILIVSVIFVSKLSAEFVLDEKKYQDDVISYKNNSREWRSRNMHLMPSFEEAQVVLKLEQKRDFESNDIDGDGVINAIDPSRYDWREIGYQPFGVLEFLSWNHDWNSFKYSEEDLRKVVDLLKEAGVSFVRMDFLWQDIEPENDKFVFDKYDFIVNLLAEKNIRILGIVGYCAPWAGDNWNSVPRNISDFVDYASNVISRYKNKIKYWEVWNEPDSKTYFQLQDGMQTYTNILKETSLAAKKIDPSCKIVLGGMTTEGYYAIKNIYRNGGKDYFDIINIHPFVDPLNPSDFKKIYFIYNNLERLKTQYADKDKKIWFTEIGCPGLPPGVESKGWWLGKYVSEDAQAKLLYLVYTDVIELADVDKVFWTFFRDNKNHFNNDVDYFGIIRWDFSKKKAFGVLQQRYARWLNLNKYLNIRRKYAR